MLHTSAFRRLVAIVFAVGALAAAVPATGLASNPGGGHGRADATR